MRKMYAQPAMEIPVAADVDVLVVGGGTAGAVAGIAAARTGAKTLVVERMATLGGVPTTDLMASCGNRFYTRDGRNILRGIPYDILARTAALGGLQSADVDEAIRGKMDIPLTVPFRSEAMAEAMLELSEEAGAELLLQTQFSHVIEAGAHPKGIVAVNKSGPIAIYAKEIVDCSGEADVACACGAPIMRSDREVSRTLPRYSTSWSLLMRMGGVDFDRVAQTLYEVDPDERWPEFDTWLSDYLGRPVAELRADSYWNKIMDPITFTHAPKEFPEQEHFSRGMHRYMTERWERERVIYNFEITLLRKYVKAAVDAGDLRLFKRVEGYGSLAFNWDGFAIGAWGDGVALVNMSTCWNGFNAMDGDHVTRAEIECRKYNYEIARFLVKYIPGFEHAFLLDMGWQTSARHARMIQGVVEGGAHLVDGKKRPLGDGVYWLGGLGSFGEPCPIPYGIFIPRGVENVFVAGKCASGANAYRSIPSCMSMGHAMGTAAALAARTGATNTTLDIRLLQDTLRAQNVLLDLPEQR